MEKISYGMQCIITWLAPMKVNLFCSSKIQNFVYKFHLFAKNMNYVLLTGTMLVRQRTTENSYKP